MHSPSSLRPFFFASIYMYMKCYLCHYAFFSFLLPSNHSCLWHVMSQLPKQRIPFIETARAKPQDGLPPPWWKLDCMLCSNYRNYQCFRDRNMIFKRSNSISHWQCVLIEMDAVSVIHALNTEQWHQSEPFHRRKLRENFGTLSVRRTANQVQSAIEFILLY